MNKSRKNRSIGAMIRNGEITRCLKAPHARRIERANRQDARREIRRELGSI